MGEDLVQLIGAAVYLSCCAADPVVRYHEQWMTAIRSA